MHDILIDKLHRYIQENNPDLLLQLEEDGKVTEYLSDKISALDELLNQLEGQPVYIIEEACMKALTQDLRPSKYDYICNILEEEFETVYQRLHELGTLKFEVINLIGECQTVFDELTFTEQNEDWQLRYTIIGAISECLESNGGYENVSDGLQQSTKIRR